MQIGVWGRTAVVSVVPPAGSRVAWITIADPDKKWAAVPPALKPHLVGRLGLKFWGADREGALPRGFSVPRTPVTAKGLFSADQARQVWRFVDQHQDVDLLIVNCEAGLSRSPAVAGAISYALGGCDAAKRFFTFPYVPNRLVYSTLLDARFKGVSGGK